VRDAYAGYDSALDPRSGPWRTGAGCLAHARRKFDELLKPGGGSSEADEALRRMARIWRLERDFAGMNAAQRLAARKGLAAPLWQDLYEWLQLFCGSELAGQRGAMVMSLVQSAKSVVTTLMPACATSCSAFRAIQRAARRVTVDRWRLLAKLRKLRILLAAAPARILISRRQWLINQGVQHARHPGINTSPPRGRLQQCTTHAVADHAIHILRSSASARAPGVVGVRRG
jgi:hypothetical protein